MNPSSLILWAHIVCMVGAIGALLGYQLSHGKEARNLADPSRKISRLVNILIAVGLVSALAYYFLTARYKMGPHYNGVVGVKFILLLGAGALIGISKGTDKGDAFRWIALIQLLLASLFASTLG